MTPAEEFDCEHERNIRGIESMNRFLRNTKPHVFVTRGQLSGPFCSFGIRWPLHDTTTMFYPSIADAMRVIDIAASQKLKPLPAHDLATGRAITV